MTDNLPLPDRDPREGMGAIFWPVMMLLGLGLFGLGLWIGGGH